MSIAEDHRRHMAYEIQKENERWRAMNKRQPSYVSLFLFMIIVALIGMLLVMVARAGWADQIDYNPPVTQAEDTASEMGRQNEEYNQRLAADEADAERYNQRLEQEQKDRELEQRIQVLEEEKKMDGVK